MNQGPKTIEELKQWYIDRNLPSETVTRFFIGKDFKGAKAFGIYKDEFTGKCVVYKNKADGTRSIRYEGRDEAYAVNELYKKLKSEIYNQRNNSPINSVGKTRGFTNQGRNYSSYYGNNYTGKSVNLLSPLALIIIFILIIFLIGLCFYNKSPQRGYYKYSGNYYYYQNGSWYKYNDVGNWRYTTVSQYLEENYSDYYSSYSYMSSYGIDEFEDSIYYKKPTTSTSSSSSHSSYDYDDDWDWDSGSSWDSDYTDWDSDW